MYRPVFTLDGLELLARIIKSCPIEPSNGGDLMRTFFFDVLIERRQITFADIEKEMVSSPYKLSVFSDIERFLKEEEIATVTERAIARYFGGSPHIYRVKKWIEGNKEAYPGFFCKNFNTEKFLVSDVLLCAEVLKLGSRGIIVLYQNNGIRVCFKNLMPFFGEMTKLTKGRKVLCHKSSIILARDIDFEAELLEIQAENKDFMNALLRVSAEGINHTELLCFSHARSMSESL